MLEAASPPNPRYFQADRNVWRLSSRKAISSFSTLFSTALLGEVAKVI